MKVASHPGTQAVHLLCYLQLEAHVLRGKSAAFFMVRAEIWNLLQEGFGNLSLKGTESTVLAVLVLLIVVGLVGTAAVAAFNPEQWVTYFHLFDESRLVSLAYFPTALDASSDPTNPDDCEENLST